MVNSIEFILLFSAYDKKFGKIGTGLKSFLG